MSIFSDSEGGCSDYEIISSSANQIEVEEPPGPESLPQDDSRLCKVSINEASQLLTSDSSPTTSISSTVTNSSSTGPISDLLAPSTEEESENSDESKSAENAQNATIRTNSISQRRERRDTDRRSQQKKKNTPESAEEPGRKLKIHWKFNLRLTDVLLVSIILILAIYCANPKPNSYESSQEMKEKVANLEYTNKVLLASLRGNDADLKMKYYELEKINWKLKEEIKEMAEQLEITTVKLAEAEEMIQALKSLAEEEVGSDRYGFDIPFNFCNDILNHEKLCRLVSEGLKTVNSHIFE